MIQTTLVLIKPGGVKRNLIGEIIRRIEARHLQVAALKLINADKKIVEEHYVEHKEKPFFKDVCNYLLSGPVVAMAIKGENAVQAVRTMMGVTNPLDATPGTIRGDLALTIEDNLTHSSADSEAASAEIDLWFPEKIIR